MTPYDQIREMEQLMESKGWKRLMEYADQQKRGRIDAAVLTPAGSMDKCVEMEFLKGEIAGIMLFCAFPEALVSDLRNQLPKEEVTNG